jgi:ribosomal protein S27E
MAQLKLDLKEIADLARKEAEDIKKRNPQQLETVVSKAVSIKCDYCNKESLIICLASKVKYCPVCGFRILNRVN